MADDDNAFSDDDDWNDGDKNGNYFLAWFN